MIFVDTSAWYANEVEDDTNHASAMEFVKKLATNRFGILVTSDYVLDETLTLIRKRRGARAAVAFLDKITETQSLTLVWIERDVFDKPADLFRTADENKSGVLQTGQASS